MLPALARRAPSRSPSAASGLARHARAAQRAGRPPRSRCPSCSSSARCCSAQPLLLQDVDPGFNQDTRRLHVTLPRRATRTRAARFRAFDGYRTTAARAARRPGGRRDEHAGASRVHVDRRRDSRGARGDRLRARAAAQVGDARATSGRWASACSPDGRSTHATRATSRAVTIVNQALARRYFRGLAGGDVSANGSRSAGRTTTLRGLPSSASSPTRSRTVSTTGRPKAYQSLGQTLQNPLTSWCGRRWPRRGVAAARRRSTAVDKDLALTWRDPNARAARGRSRRERRAGPAGRRLSVSGDDWDYYAGRSAGPPHPPDRSPTTSCRLPRRR